MGEDLAARRDPAARLTRLGRTALLLALALLAAPARAADDGPVRIGFLAASEDQLAAFRAGLAARAGAREIRVEARLSERRLDRYAPLARELALLEPAVIVAVGDHAARNARQFAPRTPIVFAGVVDPVSGGLVRSLARPGGTLTGVTSSAPDHLVRQLEVLKRLAPAVTRVAVVVNPASAAKSRELEEARAAAGGLGLELIPIAVRAPFELARVPKLLGDSRAEALVPLADPLIEYHQWYLGQEAASRGIPIVYQDPQGADRGGVIGYGPPLGPQIERAAAIALEVLDGASPATVPVEPPAKLELVVNVKVAHAHHLRVPREVRRQADRLIR